MLAQTKTAKSEKITWQQVLLTLVLLSLFPLLWIFNQRVNYRKVLTFNTKFGLNANTYSVNQLTNPTLILKYFQQTDPIFRITSKMDTPLSFEVLGRELTNGKDQVEVYEYQSPRAAGSKLKNLLGKPELYGQVASQTYQYKNVLIYNRGNTENAKILIERLINNQ